LKAYGGVSTMLRFCGLRRAPRHARKAAACDDMTIPGTEGSALFRSRPLKLVGRTRLLGRSFLPNLLDVAAKELRNLLYRRAEGEAVFEFG
jgi:hypothetical protein